MSTETAEIGANSYTVTVVYPLNQSIDVGGEEAQTAEQAVEIAHARGGVSLCNQCSREGDVGDPIGEVVEIRHQDGTLETRDSIDDERDADADRNQVIGRLAALVEVADQLAAMSTTHPSGEVRAVLRDVATKLRHADKHEGKVDLK
jgi:hypothetical protein